MIWIAGSMFLLAGMSFAIALTPQTQGDGSRCLVASALFCLAAVLALK